MGDVDVLRAELQAEYSEAIDSSTLLAILSDYDLSDNQQLIAVRRTLDIIKETSITEEDSGFDASANGGSGFLVDDTDASRHEDGSASARSGPAWSSHTDDTSSLSQEILSLDMDRLDTAEENKDTINRIGNSETLHASQLDNMDKEDKEKALIGIFPALKPFDIKWTLKKYQGDSNSAIDELMTQSFLEETGTRYRGIEAFSENDESQKSLGNRGKRKKDYANNEYVRDPPTESPMPSKWESGRHDVEFLSTKTSMPIQQINSIYHKNGASLRATIGALIDAHESIKYENEDPILQTNAYELQQEFPSIPVTRLQSILQLTYPSISGAKDLANALSSLPTEKQGKIQIEIRQKPLELDPGSGRPNLRARNAANPIDLTSTTEKVAKFRRAKEAAYSQAHSAYRKGKSDPLMGGAAAYYSQLGRDLDVQARHAESSAADALVARQSSRVELDLHGVTVKDAVRISREKVTMWWHELDQETAGRRGLGSGYKIVTGVGNHSEGGRGRLGPAVGKMLIREGWKVEVGSGALLVTGIVKRS